MTGGQENASCEVCWALVPRTMMHFHREWHDAVERASVTVPDLRAAVLRG